MMEIEFRMKSGESLSETMTQTVCLHFNIYLRQVELAALPRHYVMEMGPRICYKLPEVIQLISYVCGRSNPHMV